MVVNLPANVTRRQEGELLGFVRYLAARLERQVGRLAAWDVALERSEIGVATTVAVWDETRFVVGQGIAVDAAASIWEAMCKLEQRLLEHRTGRSVAA